MISSTPGQHNSPTDYDPTRCTLCDRKPCRPCLELAELDAQLAQVLADFKQKRCLVKSKVNNLHDPLAHVPVEIASEIFTWYHEETYRPSIFGKSPKSNQGSPLRLAAVCKTWREIAFKTPQLWTSLYIVHDPEQATPLHLQLRLVAQWLGRALKMPLYIRLQFTSNEEEEEERDVDPASLFALIRDYAPRWNALNLVMPSYFYADFMRNVEGAPLLEYLRLSPMDLNVDFFSFYFGKTPCLRSLDISHVYLSSIRIEWENLTYIQIKHLGVDEILEVLSRGTRLVDCKVSEILGDISVFALPTPFLVHNSLRNLHLHPYRATNADLRVLYDRLVLPSLQHFSYDSGGCKGTLDVDGLLSLFTRSQSSITQFSLAIPNGHVLPDDNIIIQILENLPSITHLSLTSTHPNTASKLITDKFLRRMASFSSMQHDSSSTNAFLPSLESLHYEGWWPPEKLSWRCLADIFHDPVEDSQIVKASKQLDQRQSSLPATYYRNRRPSLRYFHMTFFSRPGNRPEPIKSNDLHRLIGIRSSGVNLQIIEKHPNDESSVALVDMIKSSISRYY